MIKNLLKKIYILRITSVFLNLFGKPWKGNGVILVYHRILPDDKQLPTALYMTITGPDKSGSFLYPKGSYYVGFSRVNADGEVVMAFAGTARLVTYDLDDAKQYIKKFSNLSLIKKQMDKGNKGFGAWPATYDLTGDFKGQGKGSKITKIVSMDEIKY